MAKKIKRLLGGVNEIHCACVIHDTKYDFTYVDKLYRALCRNLTPDVILHVYTESNRPVPAPYVKHTLEEWPGVRGPKKSWWYKIQLFNPDYHSGQLLYFDLDTVIVDNIDWIWKLSQSHFWAVRDFKYLFRSRRVTLNSSVMWFNTELYRHIYTEFDSKNITKSVGKFHGDQDYIHTKVCGNKLRYFDSELVQSYKWQVKEGGYNFTKRQHFKPGEITWPSSNTSILVFHGSPNPHEENHPLLKDNWY